MPPVHRTLWKWTAIGVVAVLVVAGVAMLGFGALMSRIPEYRTQLQDWVSARTGLSVEFEQIGARWRWYGPELVFEQVAVRTADRSRALAVARRGGLAFDAWMALRTGRLSAGRLSLEGTQLSVVRTPEGRIELVGQDALPARDPNEPMFPDSLPTGRLSVSGALVSFRDLKTGRGPWVLQGVEFELRRSSGTVELEGRADLPPTLGRSLQFEARSEGSLSSPSELRWSFEIAGDELDLGGWAEVMPDDWFAPETGTGSFSLAGTLRGARPERFAGQLRFTHVGLALPEWAQPLPKASTLEIRPRDDSDGDDGSGSDPAAPAESTATVEHVEEPAAVMAAGEAASVSDTQSAPGTPDLVIYESIGAEFHVTRTATGWNLQGRNIELSRPEHRWAPSELELSWSQGADGASQVEGRIERVVLDSLWPLLAYLPETPEHARIRALKAVGEISDLEIRYAQSHAGISPQYRVSAEFSELGVSPVQKLPGLSGLSGTLRTDQGAGQVKIDAGDVVVRMPSLFRTPLPADRIVGAIGWRRADMAWEISSEALQVDTVDGRANTRFTLSVPDDGESPHIDMTARATDLDATAVPRYLPAGRLSPRTLAWLDRAFTAGRVTQAELQLQGPLRKFPFRNDEGLFLINSHIDGLAVDYQQGWQPAQQLVVDAEFRNAGMNAIVRSAVLNGMRVKESTARIRDFKRAELELDADVSGDLQQALGYLQPSPVGQALGAQFQSLEGIGPMQADVDLVLPFRKVRDRRLSVDAHIDGGQVGVRGASEHVTDVSGVLKVRDRAVSQVKLKGRFLGGPLSVDSDGTAAGDANPEIVAQGQVMAVNLARWLRLPASLSLTGGTGWRLVLPRDAGPQGARVAMLEADLQGFGIGLPEPLAKPAQAVRPLHAEIQSGADNALVRVSHGELRALLSLDRKRDRWAFDRGSVRVDGQPAALPGHTGLRVEGTIERFILDDWLKLRGDRPSSSRLHDYLRAANVRIGTFGLFGYTWSDLRGVLQATDEAWRIDVNGPEAAGRVVVPYDLDAADKLQIDLEKLVLGQRSGAGQGESDPRRLPAMHIDVGDLKLGTHGFGSVQLQTERVAQGQRFTRVSARGQSFEGEATGSWTAGSAGQAWTFDFELSSSDVRNTMQQLNYADFVAARHGRLYGTLSWPGALDEQFLGRSSGKLTLEVNDGELLNVAPGAGRMLGLMSIAALPRRLSLDFSDVTAEGLSFDAIHGDFSVSDGNAHTQNLLLRGPAAEIGVAGRIGFGARDYDQTAIVTGDLGASIPVAGALAGGPVVGAALLLFTQLFKEPLKGVTRGYYRITGNWDDPTVERIDAEQAKDAEKRAESDAGE